jgi:ParB-like chromosome segregation protein Spo0J
MSSDAAILRIEIWPIDRLREYPRNPRKNDAAVDRMCASIREFGFKIPCLVRGDGEIVDGHLRLKAARKLGITEIPVILCTEWSEAQVKAFRLMVNRSVTWADWDEELLALELEEIQESDFDLSLTGFDIGEIDKLLALEDEENANAAPPLPESPVSRPQAAVDGHGPALRYRTRLGMARSRWTQRLRAGGAELLEEADLRSHRNEDLGRHAGGLVRGVRAGAQSRGRLRLARIEVHARSAGWAAWARLSSSPADYLE